MRIVALLSPASFSTLIMFVPFSLQSCLILS
nr:MAG TPA: hypothetical protein [Caudoviricetes sp.]